VLEQPGKYLQGLSLLKSITEGTVQADEQKKAWLTLRKIFWQIVPASPTSPIQKGRTAHPLDEQFLQNLMNE
jgi:hypothetical protein